MLRFTAVAAALILATTGAANVALANGATEATEIEEPAAIEQPVVTTQPEDAAEPVTTPEPVITQPAQPGAGPAEPAAVQPQPNAMAVDTEAVYIVSDNQLWKFNKFTGQLLGCTMLPSSQVQPPGIVVEPEEPVAQPPAGAGPSLPPASSIAVDTSTVYVVRGDELLRFRSDNLQMMGSSRLVGNQMIMQDGCPPVVPGTTQQELSTGIPAQPGAGPSLRPASTYAVDVSEDITTDINTMRNMSSCDMEEAYLRALVRANSGAIAWSQLAQQRATQPQLQDFASQVISVKSEQNQQVQQWANDWYNTSVPVVVSPSDAEVYRQLQGLSGVEFDIAYMQAMLNHNAGVARMSAPVQQRVCHYDAAKMVNTVRNVQMRQSDQLRSWLSDWYNVTVQ